MWKKIWEMKIGECRINCPDNNSSERLLRVVGGYVYTYSNMYGCSSIFIKPEDVQNETMCE